jgi:hypothetical protein
MAEEDKSGRTEIPAADIAAQSRMREAERTTSVVADNRSGWTTAEEDK